MRFIYGAPPCHVPAFVGTPPPDMLVTPAVTRVLFADTVGSSGGLYHLARQLHVAVAAAFLPRATDMLGYHAAV